MDEPNIDRNDPRYKKVKRKLNQLLLMASLWASGTNDADDDEVVAIAGEFFAANFDRLWALRHPKR